MKQILNLIGGTLCGAASGRTMADIEPATGLTYGTLADSDTADVAQAVAAAKEAFPAWSALGRTRRSQYLMQLAALVERDLELLARMESIDTGKPIALARSVDIPRAVANLRFFATAILHTREDAFITDRAAVNWVLRRPRGPAGCISPWNLPLYLFTWKIAPALATGNTVVGKPSEVTPATAEHLARLSIEAGLPPGVLNIVHGTGPAVGAPLVAHPDVPAITFTGGTVTGRAIAASAAPMFKALSLELGGKNPTVIFADADPDAALAGAVRSAFTNQGQICLCGSRILVERSLYEGFVEGFVARASAMECGDPLEEDTMQGALVSAAHRERVEAAIARAVGEGGRVHCGGGRPRGLPDRCRDGYFVLPTVITDLPEGCATDAEEIFGPVVTIRPFDDESHAIRLANATRYGLAASLWTRDIGRAHRVAAALDAGTVWINCWLLRDLRTPFGGMKDSGVGREGGDDALRFFTEAVTVCVGGESAR
ncbi:MAG: aldehyde dehydrogenase [Phycisphaeraceae bacterium]|nr:aldehyde dehydrogenase [Phycisphaeraceae bacterium]